MTPKGRELHARWTKSNGAPNAQTGLRVIDRCPKGKAKAQWARFGFFTKEHQCAKGEEEACQHRSRLALRGQGEQAIAEIRMPTRLPRRFRLHRAGLPRGAQQHVFELNCAEFLFVRLQMPRTSGSGNASWQAAAVKYRFKRGRPGFRKCAALKRNGQPCGNLAMRSISVCQCHGGRMLTARLRHREKAYRQGRFSVT